MVRIPKILLAIFLIVSVGAKAQNLVLNPGFETLIVCPDDISQVDNASSWSQTTDGTSDLFSSCNGGGPGLSGYTVSVPGNFAGGQPAYNGITYGGMILYETVEPEYREYMQTTLSQPLVVGQTYCARFYVSLAGASAYAANGLGALFTTNDLSQDPTYGQFTGFYQTLPFTPQFMSNQVITDTTNWVEIGGTFVATQPYQYVTIGCFLDASSITAQPRTPGPGGSELLGAELAYYYMDEIVVELAQPTGTLTITPSSPTICLGQSVTLTASGMGANPVDWSTSQTGNSITVTPAALGTFTYSASAGNPCSGFNGSIDIDVIDCSNGQLALTVTEDTICEGESTTLTAVGGTNYNWSTGQTNVSSITVSPTATTSYSVTGNVNGNNQTLGTTIVVVPIQAGASYEVLDETTVGFFNGSTNYTGTPFWDFGDGFTSTEENPIHIYSQPGTYTAYVAVQNAEGCVDTLYFNVVLGTLQNLYFPNAFTPNGDFINDTWAPKGDSHKLIEFSIFNRWGEPIYYSSDNVNAGWDGKYMNKYCPADIYLYKAKVYFNTGEERDYRGRVALIR